MACIHFLLLIGLTSSVLAFPHHQDDIELGLEDEWDLVHYMQAFATEEFESSPQFADVEVAALYDEVTAPNLDTAEDLRQARPDVLDFGLDPNFDSWQHEAQPEMLPFELYPTDGLDLDPVRTGTRCHRHPSITQAEALPLEPTVQLEARIGKPLNTHSPAPTGPHTGSMPKIYPPKVVTGISDPSWPKYTHPAKSRSTQKVLTSGYRMPCDGSYVCREGYTMRHGLGNYCICVRGYSLTSSTSESAE